MNVTLLAANALYVRSSELRHNERYEFDLDATEEPKSTAIAGRRQRVQLRILIPPP
jgi:hypothetical protein